MKKPLELTVYPPIKECPPPSDFGYAYEDWMDNRSIERRLSASKRLTDSELAAEFQFARLDSRVRQARVNNYSGDKVLFDHYERGLEQEWVLERFATLPHYDEAAS